MNVLLLSQFFHGTRGGGEVVFRNLSKELHNRGHGVHVICQRIRGVRYTSASDAIMIHAVEPELDYAGGLPSTFLGNIVYVMHAVSVGLHVAKRNRIDVIHANNYSPIFAGLILSLLTHRPLIVTIHDVAAVNGLEFWRRWMKQFDRGTFSAFLGYLLEIVALRSPIDAIHAISDATRRDLVQIGVKAPIYVVHTGLDIEEYQFDEAGLSYENEIVFIGRLIFYKNVQVLIDAVKLLRDAGRNTKLVVIGDGPMRATWEARVKELRLESSAKFLGHISHEEKLEALKHAACLALPSAWEGFGLVILEAWSARKPVAVWAVPPLAEIVSNEVDGILVRSLDGRAWASAIGHLLDRRNQAKRMGANGYSRLLEKYSSRVQILQMEALYLRILRQRIRVQF